MKKILFFFCVLQSLITFAQDPAAIDHNFGTASGGGMVSCMVTQPDGKILVGGSRTYRNISSKGLIRLDPDGTIDPSFTYTPNYSSQNNFHIKCIALQPDGKILIGGNDTYNFLRVMRLNADGSMDLSFQTGQGINNLSPSVNAITLQADGKILVSNLYSSPGTTKNLIRLNADGSVDTTFETGFNGNVNAIAVQADGKIIAGGNFTTFKGVKENYIIRLNADGSKDSSFITGSGFNGNVHSIVIQNDGKIIASGKFTTYQGVSQKSLIRLNSDGSHDTSLINSANMSNHINKMLLQPDGKILLSSYVYDSYAHVFRCNSDGSRDASFPAASFQSRSHPLNGITDAEILAIAPLNDGKILIGGNFSFSRENIDNGIVCLNADGSRNSSFNKDTGLDGSVFCSAVQPDGKTLIGGYFDHFEGVTQKKLIRLNVDGSKDTSFNPEFQFNNAVQSILLQSDGKILVRGIFTDYGVIDRNYLVRLNPNGTFDPSFIKRFGDDLTVEIMALQPDGKILLYAFVNNWPNLPYRKLFRLNSDGSEDISFVAGNRGDLERVSSIVAQPDGKILVGGTFTTFEGVAEKYLIRLNPDGSKDSSFDIGTVFDFSNGVGKLLLQPDGKVVVSGIVTPTTGQYQSFLLRLNSDGSKDVSFAQSAGIESVRTGYGIGIYSVALQNDGKILVGGNFDTYQGIAQNRLVRLNTDGSVDTSFDVGTGFKAPVETLSLYPDGKILAGGSSSSYREVNSSYLVRLNGTFTQPTVNATTIQTNLVCPGISTGSASIVSVYDGKAPYSYLWSTGETTATISGLAAGNYSCTITDADFSTVTKNFIIITFPDLKNPTISAPATVTVNAGANCTATGVVLGTPVTSDNCSVASVTNNAPTVFPLGSTTVIWTVKDTSNNSRTASQTVIVKDVTLPTIKAPAKVTVNTNTNCTATGVTLGIPVTADNCSVVSVTNNAPTSFPLGDTVVTWTVKDGSNNLAKAYQIVTVKDATPPTLTAPATVIVKTNVNCTATGVVLGSPIAADNCSLSSVSNNAPSSFPLGNTTVTWTARDSNMNIATATQIVTVKGVTVTILNNSGTLSVAETADRYQWLTCDNGLYKYIPNETNPVFTPVQTGYYAVQLNKDGCSGTSTCFNLTALGTNDFDTQNLLKLYPNPIKDFITIETNSLDHSKLNVFDATGQFVFSKELKATSTTLNISHLSAGTYLFRISNDTGTVTKKVIKD